MISILCALVFAMPSFAQGINDKADNIVGEYLTDRGGSKSKVRVTKNADGTYSMINLSNGQYLAAKNSGSTAGTNVISYAYTGSNAQKWNIYSRDGKYVFVPVCAYDCTMDVAGGSTANGTNVQLWTFDDNAAKKYDITKVSINGGAETTVFFKAPAIPAEVGFALDLDRYNVQFAQNGKIYSGEQVKWSSTEITIDSENKVTATSAGVYKLNATYGSLKKVIYLIVKSTSSSEYVLYYNDFNEAADKKIAFMDLTGSLADCKDAYQKKIEKDGFKGDIKIINDSAMKDLADAVNSGANVVLYTCDDDYKTNCKEIVDKKNFKVVMITKEALQEGLTENTIPSVSESEVNALFEQSYSEIEKEQYQCTIDTLISKNCGLTTDLLLKLLQKK